MTGDEIDRGTERSDRAGAVDTLRPVVQHGWSGLLGGGGVVEAQPGRRLAPGVLAPFSGVLGPWVPSVDGLPPRLSFRSLPWLVHREIRTRTTERLVPDDRTDERSQDPKTPETTTVARLLRADDPAEMPGSDGDATLREVLRWRPSPGDTPPESGPSVTSRAGRSATVRAAFPPVPHTLRSNPGTVVTDDRETASSGGGDRHGTDRSSGSATTPRGEGPSPVGGVPPREAPTATGPVWSADERRTKGLSPSTDGFGPVRTAVATLATRRDRTGGGLVVDDRRPATPATRPARSWGDGREPTPASEGDRPSLAGPPVAPRSSVGRGVGATGGSPTPSSPAGDRGSAGVGGPSPLVYRQGGVATGAAPQPAVGRAGSTSAGQGARSTLPDGTPFGDTSASDDSNTIGRATPSGRAPAVEGPYGRGDADGTGRTDGTSGSPFASFPDAAAIVDHLYHELARRQRIERERRGL